MAREKTILVTHREPFHQVERDGVMTTERSIGGLISALEPAMKDQHGVWISGGKVTPTQLPYRWIPVSYPSELYESFYHGFSNGVLWPLFHSMLGNKVQFHRSDWDAYVAVNQDFAKTTLTEAAANDFVFVHDYQLCLVPAMVRAQNKKAPRIGYFLHIPFPCYDLFRTLPWAKQILEGILGADIIGFQTKNDAEHFSQCVRKMLGKKPAHVIVAPIGIDAELIYRAIDQSSVQEKSQVIHHEVGSKKLIIGVDRLDYTKGIYKRLSAFETFLQRYPEHVEQVAMIQVAVPSRGEIERYQHLREEIERLVGHINGLYARPGWTPITYMCRSLQFEELVALYLAGDIAMITPFRDGMNLVAKEYVAAHRKRPGILILSELAGAAEQLHEALMVNPYDVDGIATTLKAALDMPEREQLQRMRILNKVVAKRDVHHWLKQFRL